jgi:hypothetical protein
MKKRLVEELNKSGLGKIIFLATLAASVYWIVFRFIPKYEWAVVGVVYELLWLPVLFILFIMPIISFLFWAGEKFRPGSIYLWSLVMAIVAVLGGYLISQYGLGT